MIAQALHSGVDRLETMWLTMARVWHAQRVERAPGYVFTKFYAVPHAERWMEHLGSLAGKANVRFLEAGSLEGGAQSSALLAPMSEGQWD